MLETLSWIAIITIPIYITLTVIAQTKYDKTLRSISDKLSGRKKSYIKHNLKALIVFVIAIVYLISY